MPSVLITGANRGIGLEFAKQYVAAGWAVFAGCRTPGAADDLADLSATDGAALTILEMDVDGPEQINRAVERLEGRPLELLINNAGRVNPVAYGTAAYDGVDDPDLRNYDYDAWEKVLRTNVLGPARVTGAFVDNLAAGKNPAVVMVGSGLSSIANTWSAGRYSYRTSKAALNMLMRSAGEWLESLGITIVTISPGWTRTEMGGPNAKATAAESAAGVRQVIAGLTLGDTGKFFNFDGTELPW